MAKYRITGPDGVYEISAPDGASEQEVFSVFQQSMGAAPAPVPKAPEVNTAVDMVKGAAGGLARGVTGLVGLPGTVEQLGRMGINAAGRALGQEGDTVSPSPALATGSEVQKMVEDRITGKFYEPKTVAGKYASTIGEFAPGALFPGGAVQRVLGNVVGPAVASETAGQLAKGSGYEGAARVAGSFVGGMAPNMIARAYTPVPTSPTRQAAVQRLRNEGVDALSAGEVTGSKPLRYLEQHASDIPFSGGQAAIKSEKAAEQFTAAALRKAGGPGNRATQEVINDAFKTIGQKFDNLANQSSAVLNANDAQRIGVALRDYARMTPPSNQVPFVNEIWNDIRNHAGRPIPGPVYQRYVSTIETAARNSTDPAVSTALRAIREVLDDAVGRGLPANMQNAWRDTRREYRNLLVVAKASAAGGEAGANGLISPAQLAIATKQVQGQRNFQRGRGDYAQFARDGQAVMSPLPNSGTAGRLAAGAVGAGLGQAIGGLSAGAPGMAAGAVLGPIGSAMLARGFMSRPVQNFLGANARGLPMQTSSSMSGLVAAPHALAQVPLYPPGDPRNGQQGR